MTTQKGKVPWNLSVNRELKRLMKIQCAADESDISEVTEKLYREFLDKNAGRIAERPAGVDKTHTPAHTKERAKGTKRVSYSSSKKQSKRRPK